MESRVKVCRRGQTTAGTLGFRALEQSPRYRAWMDLEPDALSGIERYRLMISAVVPRPIAFVSTRASDASTNLAPFSYFNIVATRPVLVSVAIGQRKWQGRIVKKDTLRNIEETGEFVINMATESLVEYVNRASAEFAPGDSELEALGLTAVDSVKVKAPRVAECPVHLECVLERVVMVGDEPQQGLVIGRVVHVHVDEAVWNEQTRTVDPRALKPLARLGGIGYATLGEIIEQRRPASPTG
jgi:flavin reductase (DIM6/NTAB) family NADH-FMN oxidoreductase RutF